jgi:hypothetical protein
MLASRGGCSSPRSRQCRRLSVEACPQVSLDGALAKGQSSADSFSACREFTCAPGTLGKMHLWQLHLERNVLKVAAHRWHQNDHSANWSASRNATAACSAREKGSFGYETEFYLPTPNGGETRSQRGEEYNSAPLRTIQPKQGI